MLNRCNLVACALIVLCCGSYTGKRVHLKIIVPHVFKHHTHTRIIFVHKPKHKHRISQGQHLYRHKQPVDSSRFQTIPTSYFRQPYTSRYAPNHLRTKLIPIISKPIIVVNPQIKPPISSPILLSKINDNPNNVKHVNDYPDLKYETEPIDDKFEKMIKQHKYKDVRDYKNYHKKEEYDLKKGKNIEHNHKKNYEFGHKHGKHGKNAFGRDKHYYEQHKKVKSDNYKHDPELESFTEKSSLDTNSGYKDVLTDVSDEGEEVRQDYEYINEDPTKIINDSNTYVQDGDTFMNTYPDSTDTIINEVDHESFINGSDSEDKQNSVKLPKYEVTETNSKEEESSAVVPEDIRNEGNLSEVEDTSSDTDKVDVIQKLETNEPNEAGEKAETAVNSNEWSTGYDSAKNENIRNIDSEIEKVPEVGNKVPKNDAIVHSLEKNPQNDAFLKWAVDKGAFGLGYSRNNKNSQQIELVPPDLVSQDSIGERLSVNNVVYPLSPTTFMI